MSVIKANKHQIGSNATASKNIVLEANTDGDLVISKGVHDGTLTEVLKVKNSGGMEYIPAGTGAVATTVQRKLRERISAFDFMTAAQVADVQAGTATMDVTVPLQAFLDACKNNRGYIPAGVYKTTAALNLYPQFSYNIEGAAYRNTSNAGTVIYNTGSDNAIRLNNEPFTPPNFDSQIRLSNMTIRGNSGSQHGIYVSHAMIHLENIWVTGHGGNGVYLERAYASALKQVTCTNNYKNGCLLSIAGNAIHFDHCVFNGNSILDGYAGLYMAATPDALSENFGVVFTSCDFTGNGQSGGVTTAYGVVVQKSFAVTFNGCYWEGNKSYNLYSDSTAKNLTISGCYFQDSNNSISNVEGLVYKNNFHLRVSSPTQVSIAGGMPSARLPAEMFGNTYSGGATSNPTGGVSENVQLWHTSIPSGGTWKRGDIIWNSNFQGGGQNPGWICISAGTPGSWIPMGQAQYVYTNQGDSDATLVVGSSYTTNFWQSPLTANRTVTLSTTGAFSGARFRISRTAGSTGAFTLNVGGLKSLVTGQWCDVEYTGSSWLLSAFGSL